MKKILFINTVSGFSSTGKITGELASLPGYETLVCYGRKSDYLNIGAYKFTSFFDNCVAAAETILFDNNLDLCKNATKKLIYKIKEFNPNIIHLHNLHGYYVNVEELFKFLKEYNKPVIWTLHDCWSFTGYCPHFDMLGCEKYKSKCKDCPHGFSYPFSIFKQNVEKDFYRKKELFNSLDNLTIVTPSEWLKSKVKESFLKNNRIVVIRNGIDIPNIKLEERNDKFNILAVSSYWTKEKGIEELKKIIPLLDEEIYITIVGECKDNDPVFDRCNMVKRTNDYKELLALYSKADVLINPTLEEVLGLVNMEAQICGTPVITYNTGGSPETVDEESGVVIDKFDYKKMAKTINNLRFNYYFDSKIIKENANRFDKNNMLKEYNQLYLDLLK